MPMSPRILRPRASGFDPKSINSLAGWYDASDTASLFQNSNGTTAVSALNDPVGRWSDKSGNARHLTQTTNSQRPSFRPADRNGRGVLRMTNSGNTVMATTWNAQLSGGNSIFAVIVPRFAIPVAAYRACVRFIFTNVNAMQYESSALASPAASANRFESFANFGGTLFRSVPSAAPTQDEWIVAASVVTTSSIALFRNGAAWGAETAASGALSSTTSETLLINSDSPGGGAAAGEYDYAEILIYSSSLSASNCRSVNRYLCGKWGIAFSG